MSCFMSADDANASAPAQLLDPGDEIAVWKHIIAFRLHYDHEIDLTLHVKQHARLALALHKKAVQSVDCRIGASLERDPHANRPGKRYLGVLQRHDLGGRDLGIRALFDAHTSLHQHRHFQFDLIADPPK